MISHARRTGNHVRPPELTNLTISITWLTEMCWHIRGDAAFTSAAIRLVRHLATMRRKLSSMRRGTFQITRLSASSEAQQYAGGFEFQANLPNSESDEHVKLVRIDLMQADETAGRLKRTTTRSIKRDHGHI